eukprot:gb/GFBE01011950.1/.p1 GENE.gb/GFBE01011950.1/~~gb/GFBE01011950.1/.p1  ORF type:complete len:262 (+),score=71.92 gb/GFBE01011950.1/:1-786(+)
MSSSLSSVARALLDRDEEFKHILPAQMEEMKDIFTLFDADASGAIDPKEIRTQMRGLGFEADNTTIYQLISDLDSNGSQKLEFQEFARLLKDLDMYSPQYTSRESMRELFDYMDDLEPANRDKRIDATNLKRLAKILGDPIADVELDVMIQMADRDGKGYVSAEDFYMVMADQATKLLEEPTSRKNDTDAAKARGAPAFKKSAKIMVSDDVEQVEPVEEKTAPSPAMKKATEGGSGRSVRLTVGNDDTAISESSSSSARGF